MSGASGLFGISDPTTPWMTPETQNIMAPQQTQPDPAALAGANNSLLSKQLSGNLTQSGSQSGGSSGPSAGSALGGVASGALAGSAFGPWGSLAGGVLGGLSSLFANGGSEPIGKVSGDGDGRSDSISAVLSRDEYVLPSWYVQYVGNGSSSAGADALDDHLIEAKKKAAKHIGALPGPARD